MLCVYREVQILMKKAAAALKRKRKPSDAAAIVSYDEKPRIQTIAATSPDLPPRPGEHVSFARHYEHKRHRTVSLLARIHLLSRKVHALVKHHGARRWHMNSSAATRDITIAALYRFCRLDGAGAAAQAACRLLLRPFGSRARC